MTSTTRDILNVEVAALKDTIKFQEDNITVKQSEIDIKRKELESNISRINDISADLGAELYKSAVLTINKQESINGHTIENEV